MEAKHTEKQINDEAADINDVFLSIALSEERVLKQGFQEGFVKGSAEGEVEGFHLGYHRGAEIGAEIGYYKGVVETLLVISDKRKHDMPDKVVNALQNVLELIKQFPTSNSEDFDMIAACGNVRAKFKKACALMKIDGSFPESSKLSF
jgi:flagellar biosynthesis/type III secretory pathway protein FliH